MTKCALPVCNKPSLGGQARFEDLCAEHSLEAKEFYKDAPVADLPLIPATDTGSDERGAQLIPDGDKEAAKALKVEAKEEFGERATLTDVQNLETLKLSAPAVKDALRNSFTAWLTKGVPLSKQDPITLTVEIVNFRGQPLKSLHRVTDLDARLELTQIERLNSLLYDLPALFEELYNSFQEEKAVSSKKRQSKRVLKKTFRATLTWWGTLKQMSYDEFLKSPIKAVFMSKSPTQGVPH